MLKKLIYYKRIFCWFIDEKIGFVLVYYVFNEIKYFIFYCYYL